MSKGKQHYCSILNYLEDNNNDLYNLVQKLCVGRMFSPRPHMGVTFLEPDKLLTSQLKKMCDDGEEVKAVKHLQASVITQHLSSLDDFDDANLQNFLRQALPKAAVKDKEVKINASVVTNSNFQAREDRNNIAVFTLSGALLPIDGAPAKGDPVAKPKVAKKKGGAEYGKTRSELFEQVLRACGDGLRDPALEVLVAMLVHFKNDLNHYDLILSQLSKDTLTSLAVILQPYRNSVDQYTYIDDNAFGNFAAQYGKAHNVYAEFVIHPAPAKFYAEQMNEAALKFSQANSAINSKLAELSATVAKPTIISDISAAHAELAAAPGMPAKRQAVLRNKKLAVAESELRALGALQCEDRDIQFVERQSLYKNKCNLNAPYLCNQADVKEMDVAVYYSLPYLIARSDALVYMPFNDNTRVPLSDIVSSSGLIDLCSGMSLVSDEHYANRYDQIVKLMDVLRQSQSN